MNPFTSPITGFYGRPLEETSAEGRVRMAAGFNRADCDAALKLPDLQKTVRTAVERRLRQLKRANA